MARAPSLALALALALAASSCADARPSRSLARLERLAFVPAGECLLGPRVTGIDCSNGRPLLVDRFEVTRAEWLDWQAGQAGAIDATLAAHSSEWRPETRARPATWMNLFEARAFAAAQGMRLPTAREWMHIAAGTRAQHWPWGPTAAQSVANSLDLGLGRAAQVGTFERGRTTRGIHDLVGNVAEWVEGSLSPGVAPDLTWAAGGSFLTFQRELYRPDTSRPGGFDFNAQLFDPHHRALDIGLRLVADAGRFLSAEARTWGAGARVRERLGAVGRSWGRSALPLLEELCAAERAAPNLTALLEGARQGAP